MKKTLKTLMLCCLFTLVGIFIGSSSKSLLKGTFSNVNSSPESVVENYLMAGYLQDKKIMKRCLSDDLNDMDMLKYFSSKGGNLAEDFLLLYERCLRFKENPPQDITKEQMKVHNEIMDKVKDKKFVDIHVRSTLEKAQKKIIDMGIEDVKELSIKAELVKDEDHYLSSEGVDENYLGMTFNLTSNYKGELNTGEVNIVLQKKLGKYYIVNMPRTWY